MTRRGKSRETLRSAKDYRAGWSAQRWRHEVTRSRGHKAQGQRVYHAAEEGPHRETTRREHQDPGELQPQVGRRTRGKFAELKKYHRFRATVSVDRQSKVIAAVVSS